MASSSRLQQALDLLNQGEAGDAEALVLQLLSHVALAGAPGAVPALHTLSLAHQANLLLLLRAAPHKFPRQPVAELLRSLLQPPPGLVRPQVGPSLVQFLAQELLEEQQATEGASIATDGYALPMVPSCPDFLFCPSPAFPWAPRLVEPGAAEPPAPLPTPADAATKARLGALAALGAAPAGATGVCGGLAPGGAGGRKRAADAEAEGRAAAAWRGPKRQLQGQQPSGAEGGGGSWEGSEEDEGVREWEGEKGAGSGVAASRGEAAGLATMDGGQAHAAGEGPAAGGALPAGPAEAVRGEARLVAALEVLQGALAAAEGAASLPPAAREALDVVLIAAGAAGTAVLAQAGLETIPDDALLLVLREAVSSGSTFARCSLVAGGLLLPRLQTLEGPPSRALAAALEHLGTTNAPALLQPCLRPLLSSPGFNQHQAELLGRAAKECLPASLVPQLVAAACGDSGASSGGGPGGAGGGGHGQPGAHWNEHVVGLVQALLVARPELPQPTLQALAQAFQGASGLEPLQASVKFGKLLTTAAKQYAAGLRPYKPLLQAAASATKSFMAKAAMAAVAQL